MKENKNIINEKELELGKYLEADMLEITDSEVAGGGVTPTILSFISTFISENTCPSSACTRAC